MIIYDADDPLRQLANTKQIVHIADLRREKAYMARAIRLRQGGGGCRWRAHDCR